MENRNKILALSITIIVMLILVVGGYFIFFKKSPSTNTTIESQKKLDKLSDDIVISPVAAYDNNSVWYFNSDGKLFARRLDGSSLDEFTLPSLDTTVQKILWPPTGDDFIAIANNQTKYLYDNKSKQYKQLPSNVKNIDWMPDGKRIVYVWQTNGNKYQLILANSDTSGFRVVKDVFWPDLVVKVSPTGKHAVLYRSDVQDLNKIYGVNLETGEFKDIVVTGKNTGVTWVSADQFIYTQAVGNDSKLMLYNFTTNLSSDLNVATTLDRVVVDGTQKYLYASTTTDSNNIIWKIDLASLQQQKYYELDKTNKPRNLFMISQMVGFINSLDQKLYIIQ